MPILLSALVLLLGCSSNQGQTPKPEEAPALEADEPAAAQHQPQADVRAGLTLLQSVGIVGKLNVVEMERFGDVWREGRLVEFVFLRPSASDFVLDTPHGLTRWSVFSGDARVSTQSEPDPQALSSELASLAFLLDQALDPEWTDTLLWVPGPPIELPFANRCSNCVWDEAIVPEPLGLDTRIWLEAWGGRIHTIAVLRSGVVYRLSLYYDFTPQPFLEMDQAPETSSSPWSYQDRLPVRDVEWLEERAEGRAELEALLDQYDGTQ